MSAQLIDCDIRLCHIEPAQSAGVRREKIAKKTMNAPVTKTNLYRDRSRNAGWRVSDSCCQCALSFFSRLSGRKSLFISHTTMFPQSATGSVRELRIRKHDRMANDEVLGPRKTMFVLVIVVGCFAVLWPRILSPLIVGHTSEQLKPNQFDRDAGKSVFLTLAQCQYRWTDARF